MDRYRSLCVGCLLAVWPGAGRAAPDDPPLKGAVIVVDPGHGGQSYSKSYTGGTRGVTSKQTESELNLKVAVELARVLRDQGATVHLTREADHRLSPEGSSNADELHARIDFFEHHNCHFFLSVHHNAGAATATGHTALYKHNAASDVLYEALAWEVNDALEGVVPGPKLKLIKGSYHILRETPIPGTISESGFMTNKDFDELSTRPEYPKKEAEALAKGAIKYWAAHKEALVTLRDKLQKERAEKPRNPKTYTASALNPEYRARTKKLLTQVAPSGKYDPAKVDEYVAAFRKAVVTDPKATFTVRAEFDGKRIKLTGEVSDRTYHDRLIDVLVAMKLYAISNDIRLPKAGSWQPQTINSDADFRGLCVVGPGVAWVSGTKGTFGRTTDGGKTWLVGTVPEADKLDFRAVRAFGEDTAYLLSAGPGEGSRIYKTTDSGKRWALQFKSAEPKAFFDALAFWDEKSGIALSDPVNGRFHLVVTEDGGANWNPLPETSRPEALPNEGAFAASGTCLIARGEKDVWFCTGGAKTARVFHSADRGRTWTVRETPLAAGVESAGIFSIAFRDEKHGVIVGGDYRKPDATRATTAVTDDGGKTWKLVDKPLPYRSGVAWAKDQWVAVGTSGSDFSTDDGATWKPLDREKYNSVAFTATGEGWAVGPKGRIARFAKPDKE
jgi:photosystem II stability/assembly factor-like uncharacterized protein/N-acetylmuramoyl-L-alanine amidase